MAGIDESRQFVPLKIAVLTVSDTREEADDKSGATLVERIRAAGHAVAARQMQGGFGGMLSIRVKGGERAAIATAAHVRLWKRATSIGGVESLVEHRASVEGPDTPCPPDLLRLSTGIEDVGDLTQDLEDALKAAQR